MIRYAGIVINLTHRSVHDDAVDGRTLAELPMTVEVRVAVGFRGTAVVGQRIPARPRHFGVQHHCVEVLANADAHPA